MKLRAAAFIWYDDPETGEEVIFDAGDRCDGLDPGRLELYLEKGIVQRLDKRGEPIPEESDTDPIAELLKGSVDDVAAELAAGAFDGQLDAIDKAESDGKGRKGVRDATDARREELGVA